MVSKRRERLTQRCSFTCQNTGILDCVDVGIHNSHLYVECILPKTNVRALLNDYIIETYIETTKLDMYIQRIN